MGLLGRTFAVTSIYDIHSTKHLVVNFTSIVVGLSNGKKWRWISKAQAKGNYSSSTNTWTVEFVRSLSTPSNNGENALQEQLNPNALYNYHIAFAVSEGQLSQTYLIFYNSISFWTAFNFHSSSGFNPSQFNPAPSSFSEVSLGVAILAVLYLSYSARKLDFNAIRMGTC